MLKEQNFVNGHEYIMKLRGTGHYMMQFMYPVCYLKDSNL